MSLQKELQSDDKSIYNLNNKKNIIIDIFKLRDFDKIIDYIDNFKYQNNFLLIPFYIKKLSIFLISLDTSYNKLSLGPYLLHFYNNIFEKNLIVFSSDTYFNYIKSILIITVQYKYGVNFIKKVFSYILESKNIEIKKMSKLIKSILYKSKYTSFKYLYDTIISKNKNFIFDDEMLSIAAFNYDDRIFKFVINMFNDSNIYFSSVNNLFLSYLYNRPEKYIYKRLKYIEKYLHKIIDENPETIKYLLNINSVNVIYVIIKNYYTKKCSLDGTSICYIVDRCYNKKDILKEIYNVLNSDEEKFKLFCSNFNIWNEIIDKYDFSNSYFLDIFSDNCSHKLIYHYQFKKNKETDKMINDLITNFLINYKKKNNEEYCYQYSNINLYMLPYLKLINIHYCKTKCKVYSLYVKLKKYIVNFKKRRFIKRTLLMKPLINEMNNLQPNNKNMIMKSGTRFYKNNKQKFNREPPHLMFPGELESIKKCLIREKADGELVSKLPPNIYPFHNFNSVKAEYIDELDLYLIIDVDIKLDIRDRYNFIRNSHYCTKDKDICEINNFEDLMNCINEERKIFSKFLSMEYDNYRWYPKAAWYVKNFDDHFIQSIYNYVNLESEYNNFINIEGEYYNDGLIITPLNGYNEIKIKPKNLMTIDLQYLNGKFYDRNKNKYDIKSEIELTNKCIYRCYPFTENENTIYIARDLRYDKTKANPYNVVNNIINLNKIYYRNKESLYYFKNKFNYDIEWKKITDNNLINIKKVNKFMYDKENILDLGCGISKILKICDFTSYTGYDFDVNILSKLIKHRRDNINFNYINLRNVWNDTKDKWYDVKYTKYMNIYAVNCIMHFNTETFWSELDKVSMKGTRMMFNVVKDIDIDIKFCKKSYMKKVDNQLNYYFENIHTNNMIENLVTIKDIEQYLNKYNFKIIEKFTSKNNDITDLYEWYVFQKN